jgi:hypothetical protein
MALENNSTVNVIKNRMLYEQLTIIEDLNEFRSLILNNLIAIIQSKPLKQNQ